MDLKKIIDILYNSSSPVMIHIYEFDETIKNEEYWYNDHQSIWQKRNDLNFIDNSSLTAKVYEKLVPKVNIYVGSLTERFYYFIGFSKSALAMGIDCGVIDFTNKTIIFRNDTIENYFQYLEEFCNDTSISFSFIEPKMKKLFNFFLSKLALNVDIGNKDFIN